MKTFIQLLESANEEKLTHLEHAEDHPINAGHEGAQHAINTLRQTANALQNKPSKAKIMTKFDGSPSIVFGHHPETGKFFVASKSAFNKTPKLNYTPEDIEKNHGHAPGLVSKLKSALEHLPKVAPKSGVHQADIMHTPEDVKHSNGKVHFKPNTITYSASGNSAEGEKVKRSKIGIAVHTAYHGKTLDSMKAEYGADLSHFKEHPDVHVIHTHFKPEHASFSGKDTKEFNKHIQAASSMAKKIKPEHYGVLDDHTHKEHLKTYINSTVRNNTAPSVEGYKKHLEERGDKEAGKVKTMLAQDRKKKIYTDATEHVEQNKEHFGNILSLHHHLQKAKNTLVHAMSRKSDFEHHIAGQKTKPEGFVSVINNRPTKLTDRYEFNRMNFLKSKE